VDGFDASAAYQLREPRSTVARQARYAADHWVHLRGDCELAVDEEGVWAFCQGMLSPHPHPHPPSEAVPLGWWRYSSHPPTAACFFSYSRPCAPPCGALPWASMSLCRTPPCYPRTRRTKCCCALWTAWPRTNPRRFSRCQRRAWCMLCPLPLRTSRMKTSASAT
jgi:hypothetical protein